MNVSCLQEHLAKGLGIVGRAVAARSTLPITANVLLATEEGRLKLAATNLEIAISAWVPAQVEEEGEITVPDLIAYTESRRRGNPWRAYARDPLDVVNPKGRRYTTVRPRAPILYKRLSR